MKPTINIKERTMTVAVNPAKVRTMDMKLEIVVIPVSDVDRAKQFYGEPGLAARRRLRLSVTASA